MTTAKRPACGRWRSKRATAACPPRAGASRRFC